MRDEITIETEEEVLLLAIRDILMPRLSEKHVALLQQLFKSHYPDVNFNRLLFNNLIKFNVSSSLGKTSIKLSNLTLIQNSSFFNSMELFENKK